MKNKDNYDMLKRLIEKNEKNEIYAVYRHTTSMGTSFIDFYIAVDNDILRVTRSIAVVTGHTYDRKREAVKIGFINMSQHFKIIYNLSYKLFGDSRLHCRVLG